MSDFEIAAFDRNECLLCRKNGIVVGQVNVRDLREDNFGGYVVWNLLVYPDYRQQGVGEALIRCVLNSFEDAPVFITADPFHDEEGLDKDGLASWYQRLGFEAWQHELNPAGNWMIHEPVNENEPSGKLINSQKTHSQ